MQADHDQEDHSEKQSCKSQPNRQSITEVYAIQAGKRCVGFVDVNRTVDSVGDSGPAPELVKDILLLALSVGYEFVVMR